MGLCIPNVVINVSFYSMQNVTKSEIQISFILYN